MKSGGERQTHCTAAQERERESEQRTHRRVEEEKPIGGSSKAGDKKKKRIYLSFSVSPSLKGHFGIKWQLLSPS